MARKEFYFYLRDYWTFRIDSISYISNFQIICISLEDNLHISHSLEESLSLFLSLSFSLTVSQYSHNTKYHDKFQSKQLYNIYICMYILDGPKTWHAASISGVKVMESCSEIRPFYCIHELVSRALMQFFCLDISLFLCLDV